MTKKIDDELQAQLNKQLAASPEKESDELDLADAEDIELTPAEKRKLEKEARAEVTKELKAEKMKAYKDAEKQKAKRTALFSQGKDDKGDDLETVLVVLASHSQHIQLDGKRYYHNRAYRLSSKTAQVIKEQMFRGELHDNEVHGKNTKQFYGHRPQDRVINSSTSIHDFH